jgi:hypothetical protein
MTQDEFHRRFLHAARTMWPDSLGRWLDKLPRADGLHGDVATYEDVLGLWRRTLEPVPVEPALEVLNEMYAGRIDLPGGDRYTRWSSLPGMVRSAVRERTQGGSTGPRFVDGQPTYRCGLCLDNGWVCVWEKEAVEAAMVGRLREYVADPRKQKYGAICCSCELGVRLANKSGRPRYDPEKHWLCEEPITDKVIERIEARAAKAIQWQG